MRRILALILGALLFTALAGASGCATEDQQASKSSSVKSATTSSSSSSDESEPPPTREDPRPDGTYSLNCDYLLGDFGDSGDPSQGFRFIGGGRVKNAGNIGIVARVRFTWEQLGQDPIAYTKNVKVKRGQSKRVKVTIPATSDQIDLHQSADGDCSAKVKIMDTFGATPFE